MARRPGTLSLSSNIEPRMAAPLDARELVPLKTDLTTSGTFPYSYVGMKVVALDTGKLYILIGDDTTDPDNWKEAGSDVKKEELTQAQYDALGPSKLTNGVLYFITDSDYPTLYLNGRNYSGGADLDVDIYIPSGSIAFENLPVLSADVIGNVYDITDNFVTTSDFVEGAGHEYLAGTNVAIVNVGTKSVPVYKYDVLSGSYQKVQTDELPIPSASIVGTIYQYTGSDTAIFTNGYFYKCIEDPNNAGHYIWVSWNTQECPNGELKDDLNVTRTVGGISSGSVLTEGTSFEEIFRAMLNPVDYPTFTNPSVSISATGNKLLEVGATLDTVITATFSRGAITPAYGTSGYRSGAPLDYALNGGSAQASNTFNETVTDSNKTFVVVANYAEGEQPKDSTGVDYASPLPAGSVTSNTVTWEFVNAIWSNAAAIGTVAKEALVSKNTKQKEFTFPAATVVNPEVFDIPSTWTITAVEVLNTLSNKYEDCSSEFTVTDTTHDDAGGVSTGYKRYTNNLGYAMDSRKIRIKWS